MRTLEENVKLINKIEEQELKIKKIKEDIRNQIFETMRLEKISSAKIEGKSLEITSGRKTRKIDYETLKLEYADAYNKLVKESLTKDTLYIKRIKEGN